MPDEDARLTDFLSEAESDGEHDADADERGDEDDEAGVRNAESDDDERDRDTANRETAEGISHDANREPTETAPAVPTSVCRPDGAACDACGSVVQRRWRDGDGLLCSGCVEW